MDDKSDIEALEEFINDNAELERLEETIGDFNIFTALGIVDVEVRHSNFLSWLLDPNETHGLGDYFLASFLKKVAFKASASGMESPSVFDIDIWHFDSAEILREWRHIDIFIKSDEHRFVCAIENKITSKEHGDQLRRYKETVRNEYPGYIKLFIYLTVSGDIPSDDEYMPLSYSDIISLIEPLMEGSKRDKIGSEILTFISHYGEMLRRYVMEDSEIQDICRRIYKRHKKALDLIFEYKPDKQLEIYECLVDIIKKDQDLILEDSSKSDVRFIPKELDFIPKKGVWSKSGRILLFDTYNGSQGVIMYLTIYPGPKEIRQSLYETAGEELSLFNLAGRKLTDQFTAIYKKSILRPRDYEDIDTDELREILVSKLGSFKNTDLPKIVAKLKVFQGKEE